MRPFGIREAAEAVCGEILGQGQINEITGVSTDTRTIKPGDLFIPLMGEQFDGHRFLDAAATMGAAAILTQRKDLSLPSNIHIIYVDDTLKALQALAHWYFKAFDLPVVAITGSTGKTTTKDMIHSVLSEKFNVLKTQGNFNNHIGLPLTLFNVELHHQIVILEMGMSGFGEIHSLVGIAAPKVAVITNIGISHIEKLGSRENILKAKLEIFDYFSSDCLAVINDDNDLLHGMRKGFSFPLASFGTQSTADYRAANIELLGEWGLRYSLLADSEEFPIALKVPGGHNVYNSLAAIAVGRAFGMDMRDIQRGLLNFETGNMRLNIFSLETDIKVIDDAYNASPDSVQAAVKVLTGMEGKRRIAVLGDMLELGDYSVDAHRNIGKMLASSNIDVVVTKGKESSLIGKAAAEEGLCQKNIYHMSTNEDVNEWLHVNLSPGDRVLVKGSRGMRMEEIISYLKDRGISK